MRFSLLAIFFFCAHSLFAQNSDLKLSRLSSVRDSLWARTSNSIKWKKLRGVSSSGFDFWNLKPTSRIGKYCFNLKYGSNKKLLFLELLDCVTKRTLYEFEFYYYGREFVFFDINEFAGTTGDTIFFVPLHQQIILNSNNQKLISLDPHNGITMLDSLLRPIAAIREEESIITNKVNVTYDNGKATLYFCTPIDKQMKLDRVSDLYHLLAFNKEFNCYQSSMEANITPYNFEEAMKLIWSSTKE